MAAANPEGEKKEVVLDKKLLVAAIDFGTTYSGFAYMSYNDFADKTTENKDKKVSAPKWSSGQLLSQKTATALLLKPDKSFAYFGFEAEQKYSSLASADDEDDDADIRLGDHTKWYFFRRFKMLLHSNPELRRDTKILDESHKELNAMLVFSECIKYLKNEIYKHINKELSGVKSTDIRYVLTVPAIWDEDSKQFMEEAAVQAGIPLEQLCIALEPEAAAILCKELALERNEADGVASFSKTKAGTKFMVADLGGGTADITVFERQADDSLEEISPASGGPWGGTNVDKEFEIFLKSLLTDKVIDVFKTNSQGEYIEFMNEFEIRKREANVDKTTITLALPLSLVKTVSENSNAKSIQDLIDKSKYREQVKFIKNNNKLKFQTSVFNKLFEGTIEGIMNHIQGILEKDVKGNVDRIIVVGGFADCELLQKAIHERFPGKQVVIPQDAGLAVLKGAVIYGHMPEAVSARTARYTYGIQSWPEFIENVHPNSKRVLMDGVYRCKDVFFPFVKKGQKLKANFRKSQVFQALKPEERSLECTVYISKEESPQFITDPSCKALGVLYVPLPEYRPGRTLQVEETLIFGGTCLHVEARELNSPDVYKAKFNTLGVFHK